MADENKNTPDVAEFEAKMPAQTGNKDLWLFLIIIDVVFLCVFGFFLYKNLSARLLSSEDEKRPAPVAEQEAAPAPEEEIAVAEEVVTVTPCRVCRAASARAATCRARSEAGGARAAATGTARGKERKHCSQNQR